MCRSSSLQLEKDVSVARSVVSSCVVAQLAHSTSKIGNALRPVVTAIKAQGSVDLLLKLGLVKKQGGKYVQAEPLISTGYGIEDYQIIKFQIKMLRMAIEAFDRSNAAERSMSSLTFSMSRGTYKAMLKEMREFRARLMELAGKDESPEMVYHLNMGLFPLSKTFPRTEKT